MNRTLLIIDPAVEVAEEEGIEIFLKFWPGRHQILRPVLRTNDEDRLAEGTRAADAIVLLGSKASVHDDDTWQQTLRSALQPILNGSNPRPLLAICFGHQFVVHALGGTVDFLNQDHSKRLGVETTRFAGSRLVTNTTLRAVVSHEEVAMSAPPEYKVTAHRSGVNTDGLEHRSLPIFTTQFHPEAREAFARRQGITPEAITTEVKTDGDHLISSFLKMAINYR